MNLPTLYKLTSTGKIQTWKIYAYSYPEAKAGLNPPARIVTEYGLLNGKIQKAEESIYDGKNLGKANETSPLEQAQAEAKSQWEKKVKKGYVELLIDAEQGKIDTNMITGGVEPMLAHKYEDQGHKISFPAYVQPKLDGHRCIAIVQDGKATLWSRTRKPITGVPHIARQVEALCQRLQIDTIVLDGELYHHDYREKFEELTSFIRQETPKPGHEIVQYWIYDVLEEGWVNFSDRYRRLTTIKSWLDSADRLVIVPTFEVVSQEEMIDMFTAFLENGYEGLMVRNDAPYKNKRSYDLQKVKVMQDAEFEIVDVTEGKGKMAGKAMFHVVTAEGKEFRVKMKGTLDSLTHYLDHKEDYIGKELTVKYQNLSADGIPRFPIGERIRVNV